MNYLDFIPSDIIGVIVTHLRDINDILSIKSIRPYDNDTINRNIVVLMSKSIKHINLSDFRNCYSLLYSDDNILFGINKIEDLEDIKNFIKVSNINLFINLVSDNEFQFIPYFEKFLSYYPLPKIKGLSRMFRILFDVNRDNNNLTQASAQGTYHYGYIFNDIFDKVYFTVANLNQLRIYAKETMEPERVIYYNAMDDIIFKHINPKNLYIESYGSFNYRTYLGQDIVDMNFFSKVSPESGDVVHFIKTDEYDEVYHINNNLREFLNSEKFGVKKVVLDQLEYINANIFHDLIQLYLQVKYETQLPDYPNVFNDKNILKLFGIDYLDKDIVIQSPSLSELPDIGKLIELFKNTNIPVDTIPFKDLLTLRLPPPRSFVILNDKNRNYKMMKAIELKLSNVLRQLTGQYYE